MSDDSSLEEIEARLDELTNKEEQADELAESFNEVNDALGAISTHSLIDDETAAKISMLRYMVRQIRQHDVRVHEGIHHEREGLRRRLWELKHGEEAEA